MIIEHICICIVVIFNVSTFSIEYFTNFCTISIVYQEKKLKLLVNQYYMLLVRTFKGTLHLNIKLFRNKKGHIVLYTTYNFSSSSLL